jgi:NADH-quinone oxidoreductase subunit J
MHLILFLIFAGFCLAGAVNLLLQTHPINSALSLIVVMSSLAVLYLLLGAEFLAIAQIIVYAGAVMVLFTFVVMLLNVGEEEKTHGSKVAKIVGFPAIFVFFSIATTVLLEAQRHLDSLKMGGIRLSDAMTTIKELSQVLFTDMLLPFELTSVLILIAILGAVALARKEGHS